MSPALLRKYLTAARLVADHVVLTPTDMVFAPHPVVTDTDRDKYCVKRIVAFYNRQPTDLAEYFYACWKYKHRGEKGSSDVNVHDDLKTVAKRAGISAKYCALVWELLNAVDEVGPVAILQKKAV